MESLTKQNITLTLTAYVDRYESQNKAARSLKNVSSATISQMINGKWEQITDDMWRNVAAQIGYKNERWVAVETKSYRRLMALLTDVQDNALVMGVTSDAGTGKTFGCRQYTATHRQCYHLCCNEYWNRKLFLTELLVALGREATGYTVGEMMQDAVRTLKCQDHPMIILDEADKLTDQVLYFFITLYNQLEDECGIVLIATSNLEVRIRRGIKLNRKGYQEIWSRLGRKTVKLKGVSTADITAICEQNGITDPREIDSVIGDSDADLRRVKRKIHAILKQRESSREKTTPNAEESN